MTLEEFLSEWHSDSDKVLVHTSGSTGSPKPLMVEKKRMVASAMMTCDFLNLKEGDTALLPMPLDFIAGKMMVVRSLVRNMQLSCVVPSSNPFSDDSLQPTGRTSFDFVCMTPMQVFATLKVEKERERMKKTRHIIIGGGAINPLMEAELKEFPNNVWSSYGMTETLSHIALRRINGEGASLWYEPLSGIHVFQSEEGCLLIDAPMLVEGRLATNDIVEIHPDGRRFRILGRKDNVICSGGIKIQIEKVEQILSEYISVPFMISKRLSEKYGEEMVLLVENDTMNHAEILAVCRDNLERYHVPKQIISVEKLPLTATGKPDRATAERLSNSNS